MEAFCEGHQRPCSQFSPSQPRGTCHAPFTSWRLLLLWVWVSCLQPPYPVTANWVASTAEQYALMVWTPEVTTRVMAGLCPLQRLWGALPRLLQSLGAPGDPWPSVAWGCVPYPLPLGQSVSPKDALTGCQAYPKSSTISSSLTSVMPTKPLFPSKVTS